MPNGKLGDHPLTDWKVHGRHPFPADIEEMLDEAERIAPNWQDRLPHPEGVDWDRRFWDWAAGKHIDDGRKKLRALVEHLREHTSE